jgi:RimJ/RimL family protein N-acetyltransferase
MIRRATTSDTLDILAIYDAARRKMYAAHNYQWEKTYPAISDIKKDIDDKVLYVVVENNKIVGVASLITGIDKTYQKIIGSWQNNNDYITIHRLAGISHGIFKEFLDYISLNYKSLDIRIDTHEDNKIMIHLLEKFSFKYCGIIYCRNNTPRLAYQKENINISIS